MIRYFGIISPGKFKPRDRKTSGAFVARARELEGREVFTILEPVDAIPSDNQRRYYFGCVVKYWCEITGYSKDEMHTQLKVKFLKTVDQFGLEYVPSYQSLNTETAETYHEQCRRLALEMFGVIIPLPNEIVVTDNDLIY